MDPNRDRGSAGSGNHVDVVVSNCVFDFTPDKKKVFHEAFRVLKPGGGLVVSDMVLLKELPEVSRKSVEAYVGCIAGTIMKEEYLGDIEAAGFKEMALIFLSATARYSRSP